MAEKAQTKAAAAMADDKKRAIETAMQQIERTYGKVERRAFEPAKKPARTSLAAGIGCNVGEIVAQRAHRRITREYGVFPHALRGIDRSAHVLEVGHRAADTLGGNFKTEVIVRFKKQAFRLHEPLPHGTIGCLTKIAALGVL